MNLGGDEGDKGGDGGQRDVRGGSLRAGCGEDVVGDRRPCAQREADGKREHHHEREVADDAAGREAGVAGLKGKDRAGDGDRDDRGADQRAGRDGGLAAGHRGGRYRGDLARRQADREHAVPQRLGGHHARDRQDNAGSAVGPMASVTSRGRQAAAARRSAAGSMVTAVAKTSTAQQDVDALPGGQPGQRPLHGQPDDRRGEHRCEFGVPGQQRTEVCRGPHVTQAAIALAQSSASVRVVSTSKS